MIAEDFSASRGHRARRRAIAQVLVAAIFFAICGFAGVAAAQHTSRSTVQLGPLRIVSLVPAITETLFALGLGERVVGVSNYCDYPPEAARLPHVGSFTDPVAEAIVALRPDLVLTSPSPGNETAVRAIERTGVAVRVVQSEGGLADARSAMMEVARAVGAGTQGEALTASIDARLALVRQTAAPLERVKTAIVVGREPLVLAGPASYLGELLVLAGGVNVADAVGGRWPRVGMEFLVSTAPSVLVDLSVSMGESSQPTGDPAGAWSALASIPAVADRRVFAENASVMLRPGPRVADAAEVLFGVLHSGASLRREPKARGD